MLNTCFSDRVRTRDLGIVEGGLLRVVVALALVVMLSGCVLALEEAVLADAAAGVGATETAIGLTARASAAEPLLVSDEIASSFRSVRFSPAVRGQLSGSLAELTANGERSAMLEIDSNGTITGNGYTVARLSPENGVLYSRTGLRLGYVNRQGLLVEYLRSGQTRPVGAVRGFVRDRPTTVFADTVSGKAIGTIPANGMVRIARIGKGGYWVELEAGPTGWVPGTGMALVAILGADQQIHSCGARPGAIVTKTNRLVRYEHCRTAASGDDLVSNGHVVHVPAAAISEIWEGGLERPTNRSFRIAALSSLRSRGLIYPNPAEYNLYPEGDPRNKGTQTPGLVEAPE